MKDAAVAIRIDVVRDEAGRLAGTISSVGCDTEAFTGVLQLLALIEERVDPGGGAVPR
jgi:hypothetical protein